MATDAANSGINRDPAFQRINESYVSAVDLLKFNKSQHRQITDTPRPDGGALDIEIAGVYGETLDKLNQIHEEATQKIANLDKGISKKDFNKQVKKIKNETVLQLGKALADYNVALISKTIEAQNFSETEKAELHGMVKDLSTNNKKGKLLRLAAGMFEKPWFRKVFVKESQTHISIKKGSLGEKLELANRVVKAYDNAIKNFNIVADANFSQAVQAESGTSTTILQADIGLKINNDRAVALARNSNVVGTNAIYTVGQVFTPKQGEKQIKSYISQQANLRERNVINNQFVVTGSPTGGNATLESNLIPLNRNFDAYITDNIKDNTKIGKFGGIFGNAGTSSANREVEHVINGYLNQLSVLATSGEGAEIQVEAQRIHQVLRHGINAYRFETNPEVRDRVALQMTEELMLAAVLISVADSKKSLADVAKETTMDNPWNQSVMSLSLVTPDMFRGLIEDAKNLGKKEKVHSSEEKMWRSQYNAFQFLHDHTESISVGGYNLFVKYNISSVNTGVNAGANKYGLGTLEQWWKARASIKNINVQTDSIARRLERKLEVEKTDRPQSGSVTADKTQSEETKPKSLSKPQSEAAKADLAEIRALQKDINRLSRTPFSYLGNGNQYELASKIQILANRLADIIKLYPEDAPPPEGSKKPHVKIDGIVAMANCMSAKDRTGIEVACAFTFEQMKNEMGHYPSTEEMKKTENQERFVEIYIQMLKKYGGKEVTEINTNAPGYKVTDDAMLYPNAKAWKNMSLADIQELSGTAGA